MSITAQMELFCRSYVGPAMGNQTEAARLAGYKHPTQAGCRLMKKPKIEARLHEMREELQEARRSALREIALDQCDWVPTVNQIEGLLASIAFGIRKRKVATKEGAVVEVDYPAAQQVRSAIALARMKGAFSQTDSPDVDTGVAVLPGEVEMGLWVQIHGGDPKALEEIGEVIEGELVGSSIEDD